MSALALQPFEHHASVPDLRGYLLEPLTRQILACRLPVHVEPKVFDLLVLLIEERDRVLSRKELDARLWTGERVCAGALTQAVWSARQVLHDSPRQPRFIATVHRWGYRFIGQVEERRSAAGARAFLLSAAGEPPSLVRS